VFFDYCEHLHNTDGASDRIAPCEHHMPGRACTEPVTHVTGKCPHLEIFPPGTTCVHKHFKTGVQRQDMPLAITAAVSAAK
jgi:hypothetical protein